MSRFRFRKRKKTAEQFDINVTPMIDMFSVLISFLLITAVFSSTGAIRIEVPFLSSKAPPSKQDADKNKEKIVTVVIDKETLMLEVAISNDPAAPKKDKFNIDADGLDKLQGKLYGFRQENPKFDKVTFMTELDVTYETLVKVLDACRELKTGRQPIPWPSDYKVPKGVDPDSLIPKIILGNVLL